VPAVGLVGLGVPHAAAGKRGVGRLGQMRRNPGRGQILGDIPPPGASLGRERDVIAASEPRQPGAQVLPVGRGDLAATPDACVAPRGSQARRVGRGLRRSRVPLTRSLKPTPRSDFREPGDFGPKDLVKGFREQTASPAARPGAEDGRWPRRTARPTHCGFRAYFGRTPVRPDRGNGPAGLVRRSSGRGMTGQAATPVACLWLSSLLVARHAGQQGDAGSAITPPPSGQPARTAARRTSR
jgi:hypothetical protein